MQGFFVPISQDKIIHLYLIQLFYQKMTYQVPFSYDMMLETISRIVYAGKQGKTIVITSIHINNTLNEDYSLYFQLITTGKNSNGLLFSMDISAGNHLLDDTKYLLAPNAAIWGKSNKTSINVVVNGYEETPQLP